MAMFVYNISLVRHDWQGISTTGIVGYRIANDEQTVKGQAFDKAKETYPDFEVQDITIARVAPEDIYVAYQDMLKEAE